ncbi:hypothetical protein [Billgrantia zhangzhouensis]|nr:hypothetical protein [Halomonas zhangzhouensis]
MSLTPSNMTELGSPLPAFRLPDPHDVEVDSKRFHMVEEAQARGYACLYQ